MIYHKIPTVQSVAANGTAIAPNLPLGMTYQGILAKLGGTFTKAEITEWRMRLDSKPFVYVSGSHLDAQNSYLNIPANASYLLLPFANFKMRSQLGEAVGSLDTSIGYGSLSAEFDIGAATSPTLALWALLTPPLSAKDPNKTSIRAIMKSQHSIAASGEFSLNIPMGSKRGGLVDKLFLHHTNGTQIQVTKDGLYLVQEGDNSTNDYINTVRNTRTAQSGLIVWDTCPTDNQADMVSTLRPDGTPAAFDIRLTLSAADTVTSYTAMILPIGSV